MCSSDLEPVLSIAIPPTNLVDPARDREVNRVEAMADAAAVKASQRVIDSLRARLPDPQDHGEPGKAPRIFHFIFGFKSAGDIPYYGYLAIRSALHFNPGWAVYYYCMHEPEGPNWDRIRSRVNVVRIDDFEYFQTARFHHYAHKADVIRMIVINQVGGVYLDVDTITRRSYEDLRGHQFCMGVQAAGPSSSSGLCNAVMIGQDRKSTRLNSSHT